MQQPLRACPWCASVSADSVCRKHGQNVTVPTMTYNQLMTRLKRYQGGAELLRRAADALLIESAKEKAR